tara:strand:- start:386 stop:535 length:150 start_codon:yes stop_codon:yes gene_type:complete
MRKMITVEKDMLRFCQTILGGKIDISKVRRDGAAIVAPGQARGWQLGHA